MLGSFSFGDYFKVESLTWGWEFITKVLKMPDDKLWASVYEEDHEAYDIWKNVIGLPEERIVPLGKEDNFWEIGTGPCGPCSEIYFDRGEEYGCNNPNCKPGCDCDRYVEFWNHVFTQFNKDDAGNYTPLAHPNIDTGMGLERLACIMQNVDSIFNVDTIQYILNEVVKLSGIQYENGKVKTDISIRIITDHIRSVTFMIADGILPSNEGRGYVLRRLLRRAARHGRLLGIQGSFLPYLSQKVIAVSGSAYPELEDRKDYIHKILTIEEEKFSSTIDQGTAIIHDYIRELNDSCENILPGDKVFKLYDTYGFPLELTQEILEENGCQTDTEGFNDHMMRQKEQARAARKTEEDEGWSDDASMFIDMEQTEFTGYETLSCKSTVTALLLGNKTVNKLTAGDTGILILDRTPFYAESGGQVSDTGNIIGKDLLLNVLSVTKLKEIYTHKITVVQGEIELGQEVTAQVDVQKRNNTARNHTATHILHKALKDVLGNHVEQAGSSVNSEGLRFDFTHFEAISKEDLQRIEDIVNEKINYFLPVNTQIMSVEEAKKSGATALFDEKYGETVRVVSVGDYSTELCGGTHIINSGQIGALRILGENGVAAGVRRIEAVTGMGLYNKLRTDEDLIHNAADALKINAAGLLNRITALNDECKAGKKELEELKKQTMNSGLSDMIANAKVINGVRLITQSFKDLDINDLRSLSDEIKAQNDDVIIVFATETNGKATFMVSVSDCLLDKGYHAGNMIKKIAAVAGGGGGGKADMAQAGAKDPAKIKDALDMACSLI